MDQTYSANVTSKQCSCQLPHLFCAQFQRQATLRLTHHETNSPTTSECPGPKRDGPFMARSIWWLERCEGRSTVVWDVSLVKTPMIQEKWRGFASALLMFT